MGKSRERGDKEHTLTSRNVYIEFILLRGNDIFSSCGRKGDGQGNEILRDTTRKVSALISTKANCTSVNVIPLEEPSTYRDASTEGACAIFDQFAWNLFTEAVRVGELLHNRNQEVQLSFDVNNFLS